MRRGRARGPGRQVRRRAGALALLVALVLVGCAGTEEPGASTDLAGRSFVSTSTSGIDLVEGSRVRLIFQEDRISVRAGCNTLTGEAEWADGVLRLTGELATTMMACAADLMDQDDRLAAFLTSEPTLELDGSTLTLGDEAESITFDEQ